MTKKTGNSPALHSRLTALAIIVFYFVVRFGFLKQLDHLSLYGTYYFEALFVATVVFFHRDQLKLKLKANLPLLRDAFICWGLGLGVFAIAHSCNIPIPWDLFDKETIIFLLLIGPILEEFLFRQALWRPTEVLFSLKNKRTTTVITVVVTGLFFSFGHFHAYFGIPEFLKIFILFQTAYTFLMALWWGARYAQTGILSVPIILHMMFNFGFWIGYALTHR
jgi:membrane protease YdiL (CAAX protease family)